MRCPSCDWDLGEGPGNCTPDRCATDAAFDAAETSVDAPAIECGGLFGKPPTPEERARIDHRAGVLATLHVFVSQKRTEAMRSAEKAVGSTRHGFQSVERALADVLRQIEKIRATDRGTLSNGRAR